MIYIWVRRTIDWYDERAVRDQLDPRLRPRVDLWNETFAIPFHAFRQRLREIAEASHSRVEGAVCAAWEEIPDGALVAPVDDDDWFSPDLAAVLEREREEGVAGYRWTRTFFEVPIDFRHRLGVIRRRLMPRTRPRFFCATNNYAMPKAPGTRPLLEVHVAAGRWLEGGPPGTVKEIGGRLSAMNRSLASETSLIGGHQSSRRAALVRKARRYRALYRRPLPPELDWCRPHVAAMATLMDELEVPER